MPFHPQTELQCGPSSLATVLEWSGISVSPEELGREIFVPERQGTLQPLMVAAARQRGRVAYPVRGFGELVPNLQAGYPVVVLQNLGLFWMPVWHYAVVVGYEKKGDTVILRSGTDRRRKTGLRLFERTWKRGGYWGLLTLPPDTPPANPDRDTYLLAVAGLERAGRWQAASVGYRSILRTFPDSRVARLGLANSLYRLKNLQDAVTILQETTERYPRFAPAFNNLAHMLFELGRRREALRAALTAVEQGGDVSPYRDTLQEIRTSLR